MSDVVVALWYLCCTFTDDHACGHGVAGGDSRMMEASATRRFSYSVDLEVAIDDGHGIAAHPRRVRLVSVTGGGIANERLQLLPRC
jgi:hypothetical protein